MVKKKKWDTERTGEREDSRPVRSSKKETFEVAHGQTERMLSLVGCAGQ